MWYLTNYSSFLEHEQRKKIGTNCADRLAVVGMIERSGSGGKEMWGRR